MHHYVAFCWDVRNTPAALEAERLADMTAQGRVWQRHRIAGMIVLVREDSSPAFKTYVLPDEHGFVLGRLFRCGTDPWADTAKISIGCEEACHLASTRGQKLIESFWGGYVAFLRDAVLTTVIRDCSGRIPCLWSKIGSVDVFFADITDVAPILPRPLIDWSYLAAFIFMSDLQVRRTGLVGVTELLAGDRVQIEDGTGKQDCAWNPNLAWQMGRIDDFEEASAKVRHAMAVCVNSWASVHSGLVHSLSGGFDSAVVLSWLAKAPQRPHIHCLNRFSPSAQEDERYYARLAAKRAKVDLIEAQWQAGERRLREVILATPASSKPSVSCLWAMLDVAFRNEIAQRHRATAISTGQGGDHLFLHIGDPIAAPDFRRDQGINPRLLRVIDESARLSRKSFWQVARATLSNRKRTTESGAETTAHYKRFFVDADALPNDLFAVVTHPWVLNASDLAPGRQLQAQSIANLTNRHRPLGDLELLEELHPLISQPLIECCLRIPTYVHLRGGRRRALAKSAFHQDAPEEIIRREDKGSMISVTVAAIRESRPFLRDLLLGGILAQERLLQAPELEPILGQGYPLRSEQIYPLLACIAAEVWSRSWMQAAQVSKVA